MSPLEALAGPLQFELTRYALLEATIVSIACGVLGVLVVLRGLSFISDALAHCVVPGVVVGYLTRTSEPLWAIAAALLSAWGILFLVRRVRLGADPAIAVVFTGAFAAGLALISSTRNYLAGLTDVLFGAILAVSPQDLLASGIVACIVLAVVAGLYWPLMQVTFDPVAAEAQGLPVDRLELILYGTLALAIVAGLAAVGTMLVTGLLIIPASSARLLVRRVGTQMMVSASLGCAASWIGLYVSYYLPIASGGAMMLASGAIFAAALAISGLRARQQGRVLPARLRLTPTTERP